MGVSITPQPSSARRFSAAIIASKPSRVASSKLRPVRPTSRPEKVSDLLLIGLGLMMTHRVPGGFDQIACQNVADAAPAMKTQACQLPDRDFSKAACCRIA